MKYRIDYIIDNNSDNSCSIFENPIGKSRCTISSSIYRKIGNSFESTPFKTILDNSLITPDTNGIIKQEIDLNNGEYKIKGEVTVHNCKNNSPLIRESEYILKVEEPIINPFSTSMKIDWYDIDTNSHGGTEKKTFSSDFKKGKSIYVGRILTFNNIDNATEEQKESIKSGLSLKLYFNNILVNHDGAAANNDYKQVLESFKYMLDNRFITFRYDNKKLYVDDNSPDGKTEIQQNVEYDIQYKVLDGNDNVLAVSNILKLTLIQESDYYKGTTTLISKSVTDMYESMVVKPSNYIYDNGSTVVFDNGDNIYIQNDCYFPYEVSKGKITGINLYYSQEDANNSNKPTVLQLDAYRAPNNITSFTEVSKIHKSHLNLNSNIWATYFYIVPVLNDVEQSFEDMGSDSDIRLNVGTVLNYGDKKHTVLVDNVYTDYENTYLTDSDFNKNMQFGFVDKQSNQVIQKTNNTFNYVSDTQTLLNKGFYTKQTYDIITYSLKSFKIINSEKELDIKEELKTSMEDYKNKILQTLKTEFNKDDTYALKVAFELDQKDIRNVEKNTFEKQLDIDFIFKWKP